MLALPLNSHSALCTTHWFRICTMHCLWADCTFVSMLLQARCICAICHVRVHHVSGVNIDLTLKFFCRISTFYFLRKMSNSRYGSQELSTALFSYSHQVLLRLSCFLTLQQSKKFATQPKSLSWVVLLQFDVDCFCALRNPAKDLLVIGMMASW